jgi:hypothetical protein
MSYKEYISVNELAPYRSDWEQASVNDITYIVNKPFGRV